MKYHEPSRDPSSPPCWSSVPAASCALLSATALATLIFGICERAAAVEPAVAKQAEFEFNYGIELTKLPAGKAVRVWTPLIADGPEQSARRIATRLPEGATRVQQTTDAKFNNPLLYFEAKPDASGSLKFTLRYHVKRQAATRRQLTTNEREMLESHFLAPSTFVPNDPALTAKIAPGLMPTDDKRAVAHSLYLAVNRHLTYGKPNGQPWGRGDARWACQSGTGNCTDYHSLFIATCRTMKIPATFDIGFPIPPESQGSIAGYHCWARFLDGDQWAPVDISEGDKNPAMRDYFFGNLTADRVSVTTGRDLVLQPQSATKHINYLVYPHVEVDGKVHEEFTPTLTYRRIESD